MSNLSMFYVVFIIFVHPSDSLENGLNIIEDVNKSTFENVMQILGESEKNLDEQKIFNRSLNDYIDRENYSNIQNVFAYLYTKYFNILDENKNSNVKKYPHVNNEVKDVDYLNLLSNLINDYKENLRNKIYDNNIAKKFFINDLKNKDNFIFMNDKYYDNDLNNENNHYKFKSKNYINELNNKHLKGLNKKIYINKLGKRSQMFDYNKHSIKGFNEKFQNYINTIKNSRNLNKLNNHNSIALDFGKLLKDKENYLLKTYGNSPNFFKVLNKINLAQLLDDEDLHNEEKRKESNTMFLNPNSREIKSESKFFIEQKMNNEDLEENSEPNDLFIILKSFLDSDKNLSLLSELLESNAKKQKQNLKLDSRGFAISLPADRDFNDIDKIKVMAERVNLEKRFNEFLGGRRKRFNEFLGGKRKRFNEFLGGKKRLSEFIGRK